MPRKVNAFVNLRGIGRVGFLDDFGDFFTFDSADYVLPEYDVPTIDVSDSDFNFDFESGDVPVFDVTDFEETADTLPDVGTVAPETTFDPSVFDREDADIGAAMTQAAQSAAQTASSFSLPSATQIFDFAKSAADFGLKYYIAKEQAELAAQKLNAQMQMIPGSQPRYVTRIDPRTGRAVVVDTLTGQPVMIGADGNPVSTAGQTVQSFLDFLRAHPVLIIGGAAAVYFLIASGSGEYERRAKREKRA